MAKKPQVVQSQLKKQTSYVYLEIREDEPDKLFFGLTGEVNWPGLNDVQVRDKIRAIMDVLCGAQLTNRT